MGKTHVISKITAEITEPRDERPTEGFIKFNIDLSIQNDSKALSNEINKILERIIIKSKCVRINHLLNIFDHISQL